MRAGSASVLTLALLTASAAGLAVGTWLAAPGTPEALAAGAPITEVPVTTREFADPRNLALRVSPGEAREVTVRADGYLTRSTCTPGGSLDSGTSTFALDGAGLLNLHTSEPLWRTLATGDRGTDVAALHEALRGLGHDAPDGDRVTAGTLRAYRDAAVAAGLPAPAWGQPVDHTRVAWLPAPSVVVSRCVAATGSDVAAGDVLAELPAAISAAALVSLPADAVPGERALTVDDQQVPVDAEGRVADGAALQAIAGSRSYTEAAAAAEAGADVTLTVPWSLVTSLEVGIVPPASVQDAESGTACVRDATGNPVAVRVVGSELGQTYVTPADEAVLPAAVRTDPAPGCRG